MNRRDIMKLFGLGAVAAATPVAPAAAIPTPAITPHPLHHLFLAPLSADIHMRGGKVHRVRAHRHPDTQSIRVSIHAPATGVVMRIAIKRDGAELVTVYQSGMNTPFITLGNTIDIDIEGRPL